MDDVCNFSGINNISYTNNQEVEHKNDLFDDSFEDDFQRAHSPKPIFHKKIKFDTKYKNINKAKPKNNFYKNNKKEKMTDLNCLKNQMDDINIIDDKFKDDEYIKNIDNKKIKNDNYQEECLKNKNQKNINNKNSINSNEISNNIYNSSQGYFSFKIKKNKNNKEKEPIIEQKNESDNNKIKKVNESIAESIASSKFNFKINDDIHESEFNDVEFLD